jgi:hypothetical protein
MRLHPFRGGWVRRVLCCPLLALGLLSVPLLPACSQQSGSWLGGARGDAAYAVQDHYTKREYRIPMRDGAKLFTAVYSPKDTSETYPFLLFRTPYDIGPYGEDAFPERLGPNNEFAREGFIFVYQDVRGRFMSEGDFVNMTPHIDNKESAADVDESSDTYDTIEWLLGNVPNHNGRAGQWGISYPGFYSAAGMIDAHPALKAVSPQAPIADWYFDDFHHHGAFFLPHTFNFMASFGQPRPELTTEWPERFDHGTPDGYQFFYDMGPLGNANERYLKDEIPAWNAMVEHPDRDEFWQIRDLLPHLHDVAPAVLTVGGWFDAEDLYGPLKIYRSVERMNPGIFNVLVMGPWSHGGWNRTEGDRLGNVHFGQSNSQYYRDSVELPFFRHFLKDEGDIDIPEALVFETGANVWRMLNEWPPSEASRRKLYLQPGMGLAFDPPPAGNGVGFDQYLSDPAKPVPYTQTITTGMTREYMTDDQRFAARRPDVLVYRTEPLTEDITLAGPIMADLWVSTSGTDSDWIVKLIDVFPDDAEDYEDTPSTLHMGGYQMMVRSEAMRGRYRNSYENPEPFAPDQPTNIRLELLDVLHTFKAGHRIMVQIQSTWFPLVDRNPQSFVPNIFLASEADFVPATQRVYRSGSQATNLAIIVVDPTGWRTP